MKRILLINLFFCVLCVNATVKPRTQMFSAVQNDGTELTVVHAGDGRFSCYQTVDGLLVSRDSCGNYRYVESVDDDCSLQLAKMIAHNPSDRTSEEYKSVRTYVRADELRSKVLDASEASLREPFDRYVGLASTAPLPSVGSPKIPIVLVQFSDLKFVAAETDDSVRIFFDKFCNGTNTGVNYTGGGSYGAVKDYFIAQSDSIFQPNFQVIGPVTLSESYAYYGKDTSYSKDVNIYAFYKESIQKAQELEGDWAQFDNDSDGVIDMVYFIYAGEGQNGSDDTNTIWPKEQGSGGTIGGVKYGSYGCSNETFNGSVDGIGTICHELSHALGLPDLYDTNYVAFGMDYWDVMDSGNYCANGKCPCGYSAYERDFMGWRKLVELDPDVPQSLQLNPLNEGGVGYKITNKENPDEYYVLENRQNTGWDLYVGYSTQKYGMAHGMLVTHVDYLKSSWTSNRVNTDKNHQRLTLLPADGELLIRNSSNTLAYLESMQGDPYPGLQNVNSLEGERAVVFTGGTMNQPLTNITEHADGTVTLDYCVADSANAIPGVPVAENAYVIEGNTIRAYAHVDVVSVTGGVVATLDNGESLSLQDGVYLLRTRNTVKKILLKE